MNRKSGILLHISSLPSPYGIGDFGPSAYKFVDFLTKTKQAFWQVLPFNPTEAGFGNCPYSSISVFAGNTLFISPDLLVEDGLLAKKDIELLPAFSENRCDYLKVIGYKQKLFSLAYKNFNKIPLNSLLIKGEKDGFNGYEIFCSENSAWLDDFCIFTVIRKFFNGKIWNEWPEKLKDRDQSSLDNIIKKYGEEIEYEKFLQYVFHKQWSLLKNHCNKNGIKIIGDLPIYVCYDSVDVWKNPSIFKLNDKKQPLVVSGVPPDYFSKTGQLWGNPVYNWDVLKKTGYKWWLERITYNLKLFDILRIDHFRGLVAFWEVPSEEVTAINGHWIKAKPIDFFNTLLKQFPQMPFIAEDLGVITQDVSKIIQKFDLPGMKILLFAFGEDNPNHPYLPHNYIPHCVVYTGTHDNNTIKGWFEKEAGVEEKQRLFHYLGHEVNANNIHLELIRLAMESVADTVIFPMQDILGLDEKSRMNVPSTAKGNWEWRLLPEQLTNPASKQILEMTEFYGRNFSIGGNGVENWRKHGKKKNIYIFNK